MLARMGGNQRRGGGAKPTCWLEIGGTRRRGGAKSTPWQGLEDTNEEEEELISRSV